ncbi:MAG: DUF4143 domain-containing protein, partial [Candidatus Omnitrophica bacterium]|nr:DUF4143 domain-containing protein [Candidatus Omnitrophota bacterium]
IRKARKVYLCDSGLVNHFVRVGEGLLYENAIFQNLRMHGELNYYQKKSGVEIAFILNREKAYEVKLNPRKSDLKKLKGICEELNLKEYKIVSKDYTDLEDVIFGFML